MHRRTTLNLVAAGGIALSLPTPAAEVHAKTDKRRLGTWRSDKERTVSLWRYKTELDAEKKAKFESIFGKLTKRFTPTFAYSEYDTEKIKSKYRVLGSDHSSVVVAYVEEKGVELQQIFFEAESFYVVSGYNVEFFRRVEALYLPKKGP